MAIDCLRNEVLLPLYKVDELYEAYESKDSVVEKYLEEVKAGKSKIAPDALLPNQNVRYVNHWNFGQVAELQWKAMMEGIKKQGKINGKKILNNCLAVCDLYRMFSSRLQSMDAFLLRTTLSAVTFSFLVRTTAQNIYQSSTCRCCCSKERRARLLRY
ncbi:hypothetical protein GBA52_015815 [Prunus armeniaca]|nr:hypothetical protein GBA52_015815 [Prunus armeniaca]